MKSRRIYLISELRKINMHLLRSPRLWLPMLCQEEHCIAFDTSEHLGFTKLSRLLQHRILGPVAKRNFVYLLMHIGEAGSFNAGLEGVDSVNRLSKGGAEADEKGTPSGKERVCWKSAVVGEEAKLQISIA